MPGNALKLEPWDTTQKDETFPQVPGASAGSWGRSTSPDSTRPTTGLCGLECDEPTTFQNRSPNPRQRMVLSNRDKESLLEEIIDLKRALSDQAYHLKLHKVHYSAIQLENRKLEKDVEDLEVSGNLEAPRTGGPTRLRAKLQGLRTRLGDLQATCHIQHDELCHLRRDIRVAHTRECEVERDVYAAEIGRLQKVVKGLKALQLKISTENRELNRLKDKTTRLKLANQRLESCVTIAHKTLDRANKEVTSFRAKAIESTLEAKKCAQKIKELQEQASILEEDLGKERIEKQKVEQKIKALAQQRKEWDRKWDAKQKKKAIASALDALQARKKLKKSDEPISLDKGAHATISDSSSADSSGSDGLGKDTKLTKVQRKRETLQKLEQQKIILLKKVQAISHAFVEGEHTHYDKVISHSSFGKSKSSLSSKDQQKQQELEIDLYQGVEGATNSFLNEVEEIHYGSKIPKPNLESLSAKEVIEANAKYAKDVANDVEKSKVKKSKEGSRPNSPSKEGSRPSSPSNGGSRPISPSNEGSRPASPSSEASGMLTSSMSHFSDESSSYDTHDSSGHDLDNNRKDIIKFRKDREGGKNGKKMDSADFEEQKTSLLKKVKQASQNFIEQERTQYDKILSKIETGIRSPGSIGWFSSTSSISALDIQQEQVFESKLYEEVENGANTFLDHLKGVQYGNQVGEVARLAREREEKMLAQAEIEANARKKVEMEVAQRWKSGQNKIEVMIDQAKLEEDEYIANVKEMKGRLSVEINLKRTSDHPYVGSPRALEEQKLKEEQERLEKEARDAQYQVEYEKRMKAIMNEQALAQQKEEQARQLIEIETQREKYRGLTLDEDRKRRELEAKVAAGIPLTLEEEAKLKSLHAKMRGKSGLTSMEEAKLKELEAKVAAEIPLTMQEELEFKTLKARLKGKSGLISREEARLNELEAKLTAGITLTIEEDAELKSLRSKVRLKSGLTVEQEARVRELQAKMRNGISLTHEEEAELRDLKANMIGKFGLTGREETRLKELEAKLLSGIPLTIEEEAELNGLKSRIQGEHGLTNGQELRLMDLEAKLRSEIPLTTKEEEELKYLRAQIIGKSGLTGGEEERLKELEAKLKSGIQLTQDEELELKRLQKKLVQHNQLTKLEDERRQELEAKLVAGIKLTEEEERELKELQAKRWGEWPISKQEDARRKELEAKLRNGIPLTPEEEEELKRLQGKLKAKFPTSDFGEVDMTRSEEMRKKGKLPFIDKEMQGFIKDNIRGVLGHLENITEVIIQKQQKLAKHEVGAMATTGAAMDVLKASEHETHDHEEERLGKIKHPKDHNEQSKLGTPRTHDGGSRPGTPREEKSQSPHGEKGEHSRLGLSDDHTNNTGRSQQ